MSLLVVGAGPARIAAALQARELGAEVTVLEADQAGGTSLNRGPARVRTLARAARLMLRRVTESGIDDQASRARQSPSPSPMWT